MALTEIPLARLNPQAFIAEEVRHIAEAVGGGTAVNALSGGVDSSVVTVLGHRAVGKRLKTFFINNGIMRDGEPQRVVRFFRRMGIPVGLVDARKEFFAALKGKTDPEIKRQAITDTFYKTVFGKIVKKSGGRILLHGTIYTDVEETIAGIKRQHNILAQLGIDTRKVYGYAVLEPLVRLRKPAVRQVAKALGLPREIWNRPPFPGPALSARVIGEVTPERVEIVRKATVIVEAELMKLKPFQVMAILHADRVTGMRNNRRDYGFQIEVRSWETADCVTAKPSRFAWPVLDRLAKRLTTEVPGVVSVTYNIAAKPTSTMEAV
ncbi:MAG: ExsB family transcriptional regulator [Planctomycetota bacterium]